MILARRLQDIAEIGELRSSLRELKLQDCPLINSLDDLEPLTNLIFLGVSDCGDIESFAPLKELQKLEELYAWGSTRVVDEDLSPLADLPRLREIRMKDRRSYRPRLSDLKSSLPGAQA